METATPIPADPLGTWRALRLLIVPAFLPMIIATVGAAMLVPVLPLYLDERGLSVGSISVVLAAAGLGGSLGSVPIGEALGRWGEQATMIAAFVALALALAPVGFTDTIAILFVLQMLTGVATTAIRLSRQAFITRRLEVGQRGRALSTIGGAFRVAFLIGPLLGGVLADQIGFGATFLVAAAISAVGVVPSWRPESADLRVLDSVEAAESGSDNRMGMAASVRMHWRRLLLAGPVPILVMTARQGRFVVLPLIADDLGLTSTTVGVVVTAGTTADLALFPVAGWVMDRYGRLFAMIPSFTLIAVGAVGLGLASTASGVVAAGVVMGIGNGMGSGSMLTLGSDLAPVASAGPFLAGLATLQGLGVVAGPLLVGAVASVLDLSAAAMALAVLLGAAITWLVLVVGESSDPARIRAAGLRPSFGLNSLASRLPKLAA